MQDSDSSPGLLLATRDGSLQSVVLEQICQAELYTSAVRCCRVPPLQADSPLPSGRWVQVALVFDAQHGLQRLFQERERERERDAHARGVATAAPLAVWKKRRSRARLRAGPPTW